MSMPDGRIRGAALPKIELSTDTLHIFSEQASFDGVDWRDATQVGAAAEAFGAAMPECWPPDYVADKSDELPGWIWYFVERSKSEAKGRLAGVAVLKSWPPVSGTVQFGCAVSPDCRRNGYAARVLAAMTEWAISQPEVERVLCDVPEDHEVALRMLEAAGYRPTGIRHHGMARFGKGKGSRLAPTAELQLLAPGLVNGLNCQRIYRKR